MTDPAPNLQASIEFLQWWRRDGPWVLTRITPDKKFVQTRTFKASTLTEMHQWLASSVDAHNIYFHVNPATRELSKKAEREDIKELAWLHVDIDPRAGENIDAERTRALEMLTDRLPPGIPPPSAVVFSGGGYQGFWRLSDPVPINGQEEAYEDAKRYNQALELAFGADNCHNVDRIMRLPGSINWPDQKKRKKGRVATLAKVVTHRDVSYSIGGFRKSDLVRNPQTRLAPVSLNDLRLRGLSERLLTIAAQGAHPDEPHKASRSEWVFDFCCNALREGIEDDALVAVLLDPHYRISDSVLENGRHAERYARRQLERARAAVDNAPLTLSKDDPLRSARAFVALRRPSLVHHNGDWFAYDRGAYVELESDTIKSELYDFLDRAVMVVGSDKQVVPFRPNRRKVADVVEALNGETHKARDSFAPPCWLSGEGPSPSEILPCRNGLLHLPSRKLLPATERFFTRNVLNFDFDATAPTPARWLSFMREAWPGSGLEIQLLQEIFGYLLISDTSQQKVFLIVGPKRSGKGTIGGVLRDLVGQRNMCGVSLDELSQNFGMEPLIGKQLVIASDMRAGSRADAVKISENLLRISGEDAVTIARKYKPAWTGKLGVRFLIMTNEMPSIRDTGGALASRYVPIQMRESFYGREDTELASKLRSELPGILNWAIEGWQRLREQGRFTLPDASQEALEHLEEISSPVKAFLRETCKVDLTGETPKSEVFAAWQRWCERNGIYAGDSPRFSTQLIAATDHHVRAAKLNRNGVRSPHWVGLQLIDERPF